MPPTTRRVLLALLALHGGAALAALPPPAPGVPPAFQDNGPPLPAVRVAVLPVRNISGQVTAPVRELQAALEQALAARGIPLLERPVLDDVMARLRVRYVGGVDRETALGFWTEATTNAVLVTTLDLYEPADPPQVGLHARLAAVDGEELRLLWADSWTGAGDDHPGLLDMRLVHDPALLVARAVEQLADGLAAFLHGERPAAPAPRAPGFRERFAPRSLHVQERGGAAAPEVRRVAVLPPVNESGRRDAGEIVQLQLVRELVRMGGVDVIEPGQVRRMLLDTRTIAEGGGVSLTQTELVHDILGVDMVIAGRVSEYQQAAPGGVPAVEFTVYGIDSRLRQVTWMARSHGSGRPRLGFFGSGEVRSVHALAAELARGLVAALVRRHALGAGG
ncbi:MAG: hypothetical protein KBD01_10505 [Acidobacteria bacterium]|nr:hypothetical protein [Acidobacteriota bacterium]